jgi:hypothetical protein
LIDDGNLQIAFESTMLHSIVQQDDFCSCFVAGALGQPYPVRTDKHCRRGAPLGNQQGLITHELRPVARAWRHHHLVRCLSPVPSGNHGHFSSMPSAQLGEVDYDGRLAGASHIEIANRNDPSPDDGPHRQDAVAIGGAADRNPGSEGPRGRSQGTERDSFWNSRSSLGVPDSF